MHINCRKVVVQFDVTNSKCNTIFLYKMMWCDQVQSLLHRFLVCDFLLYASYLMCFELMLPQSLSGRLTIQSSFSSNLCFN